MTSVGSTFAHGEVVAMATGCAFVRWWL